MDAGEEQTFVGGGTGLQEIRVGVIVPVLREAYGVEAYAGSDN